LVTSAVHFPSFILNTCPAQSHFKLLKIFLKFRFLGSFFFTSFFSILSLNFTFNFDFFNFTFKDSLLAQTAAPSLREH
jgi:hypothetical protein